MLNCLNPGLARVNAQSFSLRSTSKQHHAATDAPIAYDERGTVNAHFLILSSSFLRNSPRYSLKYETVKSTDHPISLTYRVQATIGIVNDRVYYVLLIACLLPLASHCMRLIEIKIEISLDFLELTDQLRE
jgi:hypothetical protein